MNTITTYIYLFGSLLLLPIWIFLFIKEKHRKKIILCSILFGICSVLIGQLYSLKDYWHPTYLFNNILFEDFLYGFLFGGIAVSIGQVILKYDVKKIKSNNYFYFFLFIIITVLSFLIIVDFLKLNSIIAHIVPPIIIGLISIIIDKRNIKLALVSGFSTLVITIIYQNICYLIYPLFFSDIWYLENLSGYFFLNLPLEELLFGFALGFGACNFYELFSGKKYIQK